MDVTGSKETQNKPVLGKPKLGERLVEAGYLSQNQLEMALKEQRRVKEPLGQILVSLGFIEAENLSKIISEDWGVPFVKLKDFDLELDLIKTVDEEFAREHLFMPVNRDAMGRFTVAMSDPSNIMAIDAIQDHFGASIKILAATPQDLLNTIGDVFNARNDAAASSAEAEEPDSSNYSVIEKADAIIDQALSRRATDIHIEPEERLLRIRYRQDGILQQGDVLPKEMTSAVLTRFKILSGMDITERRKPQDGRFTKKKGALNVDFRVSTMPTAFGENIVIRLLDRSSVSLSLESLGIVNESYDRIVKIADQPHGLFLVAGPTGSGKTTTLYAMILVIDAMTKKVVTVEDPIEYKLPLIRQSQADAEIGYTFAEGLRTILRQDPDVILVGEIRDPETADIAVKCAMTGHMVFSSIHTNSAMGVIQRLIDLGIENYLVSSTLSGVLGQRLVRRICGKCKEIHPATAREKQWLGVDEQEELLLAQGAGCKACHDTGYAGRTVVYELFVMDDDFAELVAQKASDKEFVKLARSKNMKFMIDEGKRKIIDGITTIAEVMRVCNDTI